MRGSISHFCEHIFLELCSKFHAFITNLNNYALFSRLAAALHSTIITNSATPASTLSRFRFLSESFSVTASRPMEASGSVASDLSAYCQNIPYGDELASVDDKIRWWNDRATIYPKLSPLAADILAAPASEAYVERIFSVTGDLSTGKKNRAEVWKRKFF